MSLGLNHTKILFLVLISVCLFNGVYGYGELGEIMLLPLKIIFFPVRVIFALFVKIPLSILFFFITFPFKFFWFLVKIPINLIKLPFIILKFAARVAISVVLFPLIFVGKLLLLLAIVLKALLKIPFILILAILEFITGVIPGVSFVITPGIHALLKGVVRF